MSSKSRTGVLCHYFSTSQGLFPVLTSLFLLFDGSTTQCPNKCTCSTSGPRLSVSCGPGLTAFPANIPAKTEVFYVRVPGSGSGQQSTIFSLSPSYFASFPAVRRIGIAFCSVQSIASGTFSKLSQLVSLDLKGNKLKHLSRPVFAGLVLLEHLVLTDNVGCQLDNDVFNDLKSLKFLELGGLKLSSLGRLLTNLKSLQHLDIHGNDLFRLQLSSFANLNNLKSLDASFNDLYGVSKSLKSLLSGLNSLNLQYNPWRCNCALTWMKSLPARMVAPVRRAGGGVVCDQPQNLQFKNLFDVPDTDMKCNPAKVLSCTLLTSVSSGKSFYLECEVDGDPFPEVTWTLPDGTNASTTLMTSTKGHVNFSVSSSSYSQHNGNWKIAAGNCNGSDTKTFAIGVVTTTTPSSSTPVLSNSKQLPPGQTPKGSASGAHKTSTSNSGQGGAATTRTAQPQQFMSSPKQITNMNSNITHSTNSSGNLDTVMIVLIAAAIVSGCVFLTGICICVVVAYKSKRKVRISAKRRSVYSRPDDFDISSPSPMPPVKEIIYFQET